MSPVIAGLQTAVATALFACPPERREGSAVAFCLSSFAAGGGSAFKLRHPNHRSSPIPHQLQLIGSVFATLLGLAFGSFMNVLLSRLPQGESIVSPRSHCRNCEHTLAWWENLPLLSWIILGGHCRNCKTSISIRYPLIELAIAILWVGIWLNFSQSLLSDPHGPARTLTNLAGYATLSWLLVALAALDAEEFWLPDKLTYPGIALGLGFTLALDWTRTVNSPHHRQPTLPAIIDDLWPKILEILIAAAIILIIRLAYWLVRRKEGMGLGDAKLMAMLGAWLGLIGALESFALAILGATIAAILWLVITTTRGNTRDWAKMPLPLGTFLCLAALTEIFYPAWFWNWWSRTFLYF